MFEGGSGWKVDWLKRLKMVVYSIVLGHEKWKVEKEVAGTQKAHSME